jgi:predicted SAM-dependent methyltransferase
MSVVELGGGNSPRYCRKYGNGVNVDVRLMETVDIVADFEKPLPLPSNEYDMVYSAFCIEHLSWRKVSGFVGEVYRILQTGGKVIIVTANLKEQAQVIATKEVWDGTESNLIFGGQDHEGNFHKNGFSPEYLERVFREAGFSKVIVYPLPTCSTDMVLEAQK